MLSKGEHSAGIDCAFHQAVDAQFVQEFDQVLNRNSSGKKRAGWRWNESRFSPFVCTAGGFPLSREHLSLNFRTGGTMVM
jgi:hypothetical protein